MFKKLTLIAALGCSAGAHAGMISDYSLTGNVVKNSATGQEWLQWDETTGFSARDALQAYAKDGWRVATSEDLISLYNDFFPGFEWNARDANQVKIHAAGEGVDLGQQFNALFGAATIKDGQKQYTNDHFADVSGKWGQNYNETGAIFRHDPGEPGRQPTYWSAHATSERNGSDAPRGDGAWLYFNQYAENVGDALYGVALIRDSAIPEEGVQANVSEPGTLALLCLGLAGLATARKHSKA